MSNEVSEQILIIGHFAKKQFKNDGQTVKTNEIYKELIKKKISRINVIDTQNCRKNMILFLFKVLGSIGKSKKIILIVSSRGASFLVPLLAFFKKIFKYKICYCVVGSWLDKIIEKNRILKNGLKVVDLILVETNGLKVELKKHNICNVDIMYNFKDITLNDGLNLKRENYSFCTFSRVIEKKGIEDAMYAINELNKDGMNLKLDIYGPIGEEYAKRFSNQLFKYKKNIKYKGNVQPENSVKYISNYDLLIFPTHYLKEGLPGTIIDAYCSGTPVIASNWMYAEEFITNDTGYIYKFASKEDLKIKIKEVLENRRNIEEKRLKCLSYVNKFKPENAIKPLIEFIEK